MTIDSTALAEDTIFFHNGDIKFEGTLTMPANPDVKQLVLLIADSGPLDRNQNSARVQLNLFNDIALHLANAGIASLRYDKRGCGNSKGKYDPAGHSDLITDAQAGLLFLQQHAALTNAELFLLGHGEGALIAAQLASAQPSIAGQILICPFLQNYAELIHQQAEKSLAEIKALPGFQGKLIRFFLRLSGDQIAKQKKLIERIKKSSKATLKVRKQTINAKWIREMVAIDAGAMYARPELPTLAIGGEKDLQSPPEDTRKLSEIVKGPLDIHVLPDLTHILRCDPDEPSTQHYTQLSLQPVDADVLQIISDWLERRANHTPVLGQ